MTYTFHEDPGHGWLEVKKQELIKLGIAEKITHYSYQHGDKVYLEEDCDLATFMMAKKSAREDVTLVTSHTDNDSPIRRLARFYV